MNFFEFFLPSVAWCDKAVNWQCGFQDPASPIAEGIIRFHHDIMILLTGVVIFVGWIMFRAWLLYSEWSEGKGSGLVHASWLEIIWTRIPAGRLVLIGWPSVILLYSMEEQVDPSVTRKVVGHQWYWSYEYSDFARAYGDSFSYDSYIIPDSDLQATELRLLSVDKKVFLPADTHIRLIVTSGDVLHCWTIPSFGVKIDACPGRLNQVNLFLTRTGAFYGQCSEICGVNHGFMPICVQVLEPEVWIRSIELFAENDGNWVEEGQRKIIDNLFVGDNFRKKSMFGKMWDNSFVHRKIQEAFRENDKS